MPVHWIWGLQVLSPLCWVFELMFSLLGPGNLLGPWHLGLPSGYSQFPFPHCYTPPFKLLTLCTSPPSTPTSELVPPFPSLFCLPPTSFSSSSSQRLFSTPYCVGLYHAHFGVIFFLLGFHMVSELYCGYSKLLVSIWLDHRVLNYFIKCDFCTVFEYICFGNEINI